MKPDALDALVEGYLDYLSEVRRLTPRTVADVRCTLKGVSAYMAEAKPDVPLWKLELPDYLAWLDAEREAGRTSACLCKYVSHVRGLLDYAWRSGRSDRNVLDGFRLQDAGKAKRKPPRSLTVQEARRLVEACPAKTAPQRRERLMVLLLYGCGLRTGEVCRLNVQDVDVEKRELLILEAKGDRQRVVPVPEGVMPALLAYLHERGGRRGPLLRTAVKRRRIRSRDVCEVVGEAVERAGLEGPVTPRTLRHSYATHLMDAGVDLAVIASLMGHRSPAETGVYLHARKQEKRRAVGRLGENEDENREGDER